MLMCPIFSMKIGKIFWWSTPFGKVFKNFFSSWNFFFRGPRFWRVKNQKSYLYGI